MAWRIFRPSKDFKPLDRLKILKPTTNNNFTRKFIDSIDSGVCTITTKQSKESIMEEVNSMEWRRHEVYVNYHNDSMQVVACFRGRRDALDYMRSVFDSPNEHVDETWAHPWSYVSHIGIDDCEGGRMKNVKHVKVKPIGTKSEAVRSIAKSRGFKLFKTKPSDNHYPLVPWYARKILLALIVKVCYKELRYKYDGNGQCHRRMTFVKSTELMLGEPIKELRCKPIIIKHPWEPVLFEGY